MSGAGARAVEGLDRAEVRPDDEGLSLGWWPADGGRAAAPPEPIDAAAEADAQAALARRLADLGLPTSGRIACAGPGSDLLAPRLAALLTGATVEAIGDAQWTLPLDGQREALVLLHHGTERELAERLHAALRHLRPGARIVVGALLTGGPGRLGEIVAAAGCVAAETVDATREIWLGTFWSAVTRFHREFRRGVIDQEGLLARLAGVHRLAESGATAALATALTPDAPPATPATLPPLEGLPPARRYPMGDPARRFAFGYDTVMYWPALEEYFGHSDFVNFGYWDGTARDAGSASAALVDQLLALLPDLGRGTILDVACGKGATSRRLQRHYPAGAITGINISERQLETCRANAPGSRFLRMDATALEFPDASFDNILCVEAAFHFRTRERFFHEAFRVLRPGGRLVLCDILLTREAEARRPGRHVENHLASPAAYADLGRAAGFDEVRVRDVSGECFDGAFWHLVRFAHERLLAREMSPGDLKAFCSHVFEFVPDFRHYLLASLRKPGPAARQGACHAGT